MTVCDSESIHARGCWCHGFQDRSPRRLNTQVHVAVVGLRLKPHLISGKARALTEREIFPNRGQVTS
jgi:hypothetical protein